MKLSIEEQKNFLFDRLKIEPLRETEANKEDIKVFVQATKGGEISNYLINNAWNDDCDRNTKVFLVRDQETKEIAFFFALNCGILFSELNIWNLSQEEKEPFDKYVEAMQKLKDSNLSKEYRPTIQLDFRLGVYIFWEIIVPHLLEIAEKVGCKYIYLFAADNTEQVEKVVDTPPMWTPDYDPYADEDEKEAAKEEIHTLVNYYINELKFRYVSKYKILKPHYERRCYTLVQEVESLQCNREAVWQSHITEDVS